MKTLKEITSLGVKTLSRINLQNMALTFSLVLIKRHFWMDLFHYKLLVQRWWCLIPPLLSLNDAEWLNSLQHVIHQVNKNRNSCIAMVTGNPSRICDLLCSFLASLVWISHQRGRQQIFSESEDKKSQFWSKDKPMAIPSLQAKEGSALEMCLKSPGGSLTKQGSNTSKPQTYHPLLHYQMAALHSKAELWGALQWPFCWLNSSTERLQR